MNCRIVELANKVERTLLAKRIYLVHWFLMLEWLVC